MFFAIIGKPIQHARSPLMQNTALRAAGLAEAYRAVEVDPGNLEQAVRKLVTDGCKGFNVTVPHKQAVIPLLDSISDEAKRIGAVNTVVVSNASLHGYNTDVDGFRASLEPFTERVRNAKVVLLGAGGSARTAAYCLVKDFSPAGITIVARSAQKGVELAKTFSERVPLSVCSFSDGTLPSAIEQAALVVNATPVGMHPDVRVSPLPADAPFHRGQIVFDLIYTPLQTTLLRHAAARGATTINGLEMLLLQGARAFHLFTGKQMPVDKVREAVLNSLQT